MARKQIRYLVLDCETATLPFASEIAEGDAEKKKKIAIARPLIYDIGWTITNRKGEILDSKQFLIAETFSVPAVFNTAYYAEKRPLYLDMLKRKETEIKPWNEVAEILLSDLRNVDSVGAYNSMFDFKKAIPFTDLYIRKLYSPDYFQWEAIQRRLCYKIANERYRKDEEKEFDGENFRFRDEEFPLFDLWGLAARHLLNNATYKKNCLKHEMLTASGTFFKTSAEASYRYLQDKYDFDEAHTALDDAIIETYILSQIAKRHAITIGIIFFPFRELGTTDEFVMRRKNPDEDEVNTVIDAIEKYLESKEQSNYTARLENILARLAKYLTK
jgi:hypothetical protein